MGELGTLRQGVKTARSGLPDNSRQVDVMKGTQPKNCSLSPRVSMKHWKTRLRSPARNA